MTQPVTTEQAAAIAAERNSGTPDDILPTGHHTATLVCCMRETDEHGEESLVPIGRADMAKFNGATIKAAIKAAAPGTELAQLARDAGATSLQLVWTIESTWTRRPTAAETIAQVQAAERAKRDQMESQLLQMAARLAELEAAAAKPKRKPAKRAGKAGN